jgi:Icc-related predicted phosphoesterase
VRVLALSDEVVSFIYSPVVKDRFYDVDFIVGCGDLPTEYLEYVLTVLDVPLFYVPGNHDHDQLDVPGGCNVDGKYTVVEGLTILGLGGSPRYKARGNHQYTETEMRIRVIWKAINAVVRPSVLREGLDLFISHAPLRGVHDAPDVAHRGFRSFHLLLKWLRPKLMLHGHTHTPPNIVASETIVGSTRVINAYPYKQIVLGE